MVIEKELPLKYKILAELAKLEVGQELPVSTEVWRYAQSIINRFMKDSPDGPRFKTRSMELPTGMTCKIIRVK